MTPQTEIPNASTQAPLASVPAAPSTGFKSSEFAVVVGTVVAIGSGHVPTDLVPVLSAVAGVYAACRTLLKAVHALGYAKGIPDLPNLPKE